MSDDDDARSMFDDLDEDGYALDEDASDRRVLHHIWTLLETGDLCPGEAWTVLWTRYPEEPAFRLLSTAGLAEANGTSPAPSVLAELVSGLPPDMRDVGRALLVVMSNHVPTPAVGLELEKLARAHGATLPLDDAYAQLAHYEQAVLARAERETRGDRPWKEKPTEAPLDYEGALARFPGEAKPYSPRAPFSVGDRIAHPRFQLGVVVSSAPSRITVIFADATRTLVCA